MKAKGKVIAGLDECLKYERTAHDCYEQYAVYFQRWHFDRFKAMFSSLACKAAERKRQLMKRLNVLDSIPANDRYEIEVTPLEEAPQIEDIVAYFRKMLGEAREAYEVARGDAKDAGDSVTAKILGRNKAQIERELARFEAKQRRIDLVGVEQYLAHHMHIEN